MLFVYSYLWLLTDGLTTRLQQSHRRAQTGQGLVEYALIIGVVAVAVIGIAFAFGGKIANIFSNINTSIDKCAPAGTTATCPTPAP